MSQYTKALGARMRDVRIQQGMSLQRVEDRSRGRFGGVSLASYERGVRAVTAVRLAGLAEFYGVPVTALLPDQGRRKSETDAAAPRLVLDLRAVSHLDPHGALAPLPKFADAVRTWRGDWAGRVLSVRTSDHTTLALMCDLDQATLVDRLVEAGVALSGDRLADTLAWKTGTATGPVTA